MKYSVIKKEFGSLLNNPCWNIRRGQWKSAVSFEFGKPSLKIYERRRTLPGNKSLVLKRIVLVNGEWHLMFDGCSWKAFSMGRKICDWRSKENPDMIACFFSGQALNDVIIKPETGESTFLFDLGGRFETHPHDDDDQWSLYLPSGKVLTYRADGKYSFSSGNKPIPDKQWKSFTV